MEDITSNETQEIKDKWFNFIKDFTDYFIVVGSKANLEKLFDRLEITFDGSMKVGKAYIRDIVVDFVEANQFGAEIRLLYTEPRTTYGIPRFPHVESKLLPQEKFVGKMK